MSKDRSAESPQLAELGERKIVEMLMAKTSSSAAVPLGDDCGAVEIEGRLLLLSTDTKTVETHFPPQFTFKDMGWSMAAANLSDIAAMGGKPVAFLVAYGLPDDFIFDSLKQIQEGILACLDRYDTPLVGADTKENRNLTLTGSVAGLVDKDKALLRSGSSPGDLLCVTGKLGGATLGLKSMAEGLHLEMAEERFRRPEPRIREGMAMASSKKVTSCIDISDGLSSSLYELMRSCHNGFEVGASKVPLHASLRESGMDEQGALQMALHSGDEYELLFTTGEKAVDSLKKSFQIEGLVDFEIIGRVIEEEKIVLRHEGVERELEDLGYRHFMRSR